MEFYSVVFLFLNCLMNLLPFIFCSFTNLDFLIPHLVHFDCIITLLFFVLKIFEFKFPGFFFYTLHNMFSFYFTTSASKKRMINFYFPFQIFIFKFISKSFFSQIAHFDFPLILFFEIRSNFLETYYLRCFSFKFACFVI